jgi:tetratricopeptide (TPR) repeat protein
MVDPDQARPRLRALGLERYGRRLLMLEDLAALYITRGRPVEAEPLLRESVAILEQAAEQDSSHIARARNQLGRCLDSLGRSAEAESLFTRTRLIQQAQGATPDHGAFPHLRGRAPAHRWAGAHISLHAEAAFLACPLRSGSGVRVRAAATDRKPRIRAAPLEAENGLRRATPEPPVLGAKRPSRRRPGMFQRRELARGGQ